MGRAGGSALSDRFNVFWTPFMLACNKLAASIPPDREYKAVVAVARGGMIPATILAHWLKVRRVVSVQVLSYSDDHDQQNRPVILDAYGTTEPCLIVDDIADTGDTLEALRPFYPQGDFAAVFAKPKGESLCQFVGERVPQRTWVQFPWEA